LFATPVAQKPLNIRRRRLENYDNDLYKFLRCQTVQTLNSLAILLGFQITGLNKVPKVDAIYDAFVNEDEDLATKLVDLRRIAEDNHIKANHYRQLKITMPIMMTTTTTKENNLCEQLSRTLPNPPKRT
jgi:hypothetical protein